MDIQELNDFNNKDHKEIKESINRLEAALLVMTADIAKINGSNNLVPTMIKWIIFPLILILGGLIGYDLSGLRTA